MPTIVKSSLNLLTKHQPLALKELSYALIFVEETGVWDLDWDNVMDLIILESTRTHIEAITIQKLPSKNLIVPAGDAFPEF